MGLLNWNSNQIFVANLITQKRKNYKEISHVIKQPGHITSFQEFICNVCKKYLQDAFKNN